MSYLKRAAAGATTAAPVHTPILGRARDMARSDGGGYAFKLDGWAHLRRWLILGSSGGTYYANETKHTMRALESLAELVAEDGPRVVALAREVSDRGLAKTNDEALYALAFAVVEGDEATKAAAYQALPDVARIGTHLFLWLSFIRELRGKPHLAGGPGLRRAVWRWMHLKGHDGLAHQAVKYRARHGVSWDDVLRVAHPKPATPEMATVLEWIALPPKGSRADTSGRLPRIIEGFLAAQRSTSVAETARLAREYRLPREALLTEHLKSPEVNMAMLEAGMPMTALIRNLANLTRYGVLEKASDGERLAIERITNAEAIAKARVHPMTVLIALFVYAAGRSEVTGHTWFPNGNVIEALDEAFYLAFGNVQPTGKRRLVAIDVSPSMSHPHYSSVPGVPGMTAMHAAAAMAMTTVHADSNTTDVVMFANGLEPVPITKRTRLDDVGRIVEGAQWSRSTDISLPFRWAESKARQYDAFEVYTDGEANRGVHPTQALASYRRSLVRDARLVVAGITATPFSIADPRDPGNLDVVGMDASAPALIAEFVAGRL